MVGAMRVMTCQTIVGDGRMFKKEGAALFSVASGTGLVHCRGVQQRISIAAMGVMTVCAADLAFKQGHVRSPFEVDSLFFVTKETGFIDGCLRQKAITVQSVAA